MDQWHDLIVILRWVLLIWWLYRLTTVPRLADVVRYGFLVVILLM